MDASGFAVTGFCLLGHHAQHSVTSKSEKDPSQDKYSVISWTTLIVSYKPK